MCVGGRRGGGGGVYFGWFWLGVIKRNECMKEGEEGRRRRTRRRGRKRRGRRRAAI